MDGRKRNVTKYREPRAPTAESIHAIDYSTRLELFETEKGNPARNRS